MESPASETISTLSGASPGTTQVVSAGCPSTAAPAGVQQPSHADQPADAVVDVVGAALPHAPNVAVFDTAFFHDLPEVARHDAVPGDWGAAGELRRFGFHGIAHAYLSSRLAERRALSHRGRAPASS